MKTSHETSITIRRVAQKAVGMLAIQGMEQARLEAEVLLAHVLEMRREELIVRPNQELTESQMAEFHLLVERRCRKEPLAYILGYREFWSLEFKVNGNVLIPRPETEEMIAHLLDLAGEKTGEKEIRILDSGTGSGVLAVIAAVELPQARVTALDSSTDALTIAQENALRHQVADRIQFLNMDFMRDWSFSESDPYDYILSNPPYIPSRQIDQLMPDIRDYEPRMALEGGTDGLDCYRRIIENGFSHLKPGGHMIFEVGEGQATPVKQCLQDGGLNNIETIKDLGGHDRVVSARRGLG